MLLTVSGKQALSANPCSLNTSCTPWWQRAKALGVTGWMSVESDNKWLLIRAHFHNEQARARRRDGKQMTFLSSTVDRRACDTTATADVSSDTV